MNKVNYNLIPVDYSLIKPYFTRARDEGISMEQTPRTTWYQPIGVEGFIALMNIRGTHYRAKAGWIAPAYRGLGAGRQMIEDIVNLALDLEDCRKLSILTAKPEFYTKRWAFDVFYYKPGIWRIVYDK